MHHRCALCIKIKNSWTVSTSMKQHLLYDENTAYCHSYSYSFSQNVVLFSETWPTKVEHELKLNHTEMSMIRWMCGVKLNERKKSEELRELLGLEPISLMIKKSRLRWFGHVERKDDNDWVKRCITWEDERIRQTGRPKKTWCDSVNDDMESLDLPQKDLQFKNKWRKRIQN